MTERHKYNLVGPVLAITGAFGVLSAPLSGQTFLPPPIDHPFPQANAGFGVATAGGLFLDVEGLPGIAVSAYHQDVGPFPDQGQVYLFVQSSGTFAFIDVLDDPEPQANAIFGIALANIGDLDGDSRPEIAVAATGQDVGGNADQGRVYVFSGLSGALLCTVDHPTPQAGAEFGYGLAGIGDVDGDLIADFAVCAPLHDVPGTPEAGRLFVFAGSDCGLLYTVENPNLPDYRPHFGRAIAAMGDVNDDGTPDFAVSAPYFQGGPYVGVGRAYMFSGVDGSLLFEIIKPDPQPNAIPGTTAQFANVGDVTGDGVADLAMAAHLQDVMGTFDQGQAWVFSGADGSLHCTLDDPFPHPSALFGCNAVGGVGDVDGDSVPDIFVGAPRQDVDGHDCQGQGFIFSGATCEVMAVFDHPFPQPGGPSGSWFPTFFAKVGDVDGNGASDFVVAALAQDVGGNVDQGQMYVFGLPALELEAQLDIKPGSCPNPFNRKSRGVLPVAVLGTMDFDVTTIDVSTVRLARADGVGGEVAPLEGPPGPHSVFEDVATPFEGEPCDCHDLGADGYLDLSMKFSSPDVVAVLELDDVPGGSELELVVTGSLLDETPFVAYDCIVLRPQR